MTRADTLAIMVCYNTADATRATAGRFPSVRDYDVVAIDDGSTDQTQDYLTASTLEVVVHPHNRGLGAAIKSGVRLALDRGYERIVILAGNGKDNPMEVPRLLSPLRQNMADYVQGSRFLPGGTFAHLPVARRILIRMHAQIMRLLTGFPFSDSINGFRAYSTKLFADRRINVWQDWLDRYEYETYLHYKAVTLGYRVVEVPVSKTYPPPHPGRRYSHIRPILDWWGILRPLVLLRLGLRH